MSLFISWPNSHRSPKPCFLFRLASWSLSCKHTPRHPWSLYSTLVVGGHAQDPGASGPLVLDAILALGQSEVPGVIVAGGIHRVCLIKLVGSKKCMHICTAAPWLSKHEFFLLIQSKESVLPLQILTTENVISCSLFIITEFHHNKTIQCSCGCNSVVAIFTQ